PEEDIKTEPMPFLGITYVKINKYLKRLYNLSVDKGVVVIVVVKNSPAEKAGIQPGDVILSVEKNRIRSVSSLTRALRKMKIGETVNFEILRSGSYQDIAIQAEEAPIVVPVTVGSMPKRVSFTMVDAQEVNAAAGRDTIFVSYGLLNFVKSEDEIAAVLAHELAHAVRGHLLKMQGGQILSVIAAIGLGIAAETASPGSGEGVMRGVGAIGDVFNASYSRNLEREADYFGTKFVYYAGYDVDVCATIHERFAVEIPQSMIKNYLSTHPASPERMLRIKKIIKELKTGKVTSQGFGQE
ncbi:MAG TPA: PDZ domain-containing protein, partial [bacterium (Candidatus Stahlbacteria)]|nr:PDZ domain-containing protein [Candidatus Stahlbacteria bacterium]